MRTAPSGARNAGSAPRPQARTSNGINETVNGARRSRDRLFRWPSNGRKSTDVAALKRAEARAPVVMRSLLIEDRASAAGFVHAAPRCAGGYDGASIRKSPGWRFMGDGFTV